MKGSVILGLFVPLALFSGCAAPGRLNTPSGRPEVFVENASLEEASGACVQYLIQQGCDIERSSNQLVQGVKLTNNLAADMFLGSRYDSQTWYRIIFSLARIQNGVKIYGLQYLISNRGSAFEKTMALDRQQHYEGTQGALQSIKATILASKPPATTPAESGKSQSQEGYKN